MNDVSVYSVTEDAVYMVYSVVMVGQIFKDCQIKCMYIIYTASMGYCPYSTQHHQFKMLPAGSQQYWEQIMNIWLINNSS